MGSSFTQRQVDDSTVEFTVTPGKIGNTVGGYALAGVVGFFLAFNGANEGGASIFQLLFGVATGSGVHPGIVYWRTQRADRMRNPGGTFHASPEGIVLGSGVRIPRSDIEDFHALSLVESLPYCHMLVANAKEHDVTTLAGGMDQETAESLVRAVKAQLGMS